VSRISLKESQLTSKVKEYRIPAQLTLAMDEGRKYQPV
jgi:hypothetical protein